MQEYRIETTLQRDGALTLEDLPFQAGESVEIIILARASQAHSGKRYPLRGAAIRYNEPTNPVAQNDWEATT